MAQMCGPIKQALVDAIQKYWHVAQLSQRCCCYLLRVRSVLPTAM